MPRVSARRARHPSRSPAHAPREPSRTTRLVEHAAGCESRLGATSGLNIRSHHLLASKLYPCTRGRFRNPKGRSRGVARSPSGTLLTKRGLIGNGLLVGFKNANDDRDGPIPAWLRCHATYPWSVGELARPPSPLEVHPRIGCALAASARGALRKKGAHPDGPPVRGDATMALHMRGCVE